MPWKSKVMSRVMTISASMRALWARTQASSSSLMAGAGRPPLSLRRYRASMTSAKESDDSLWRIDADSRAARKS